MDDLISRQAAIDALDEIESEVADGYGYQYEKWRKYFCGLPPAQPEIIRCKDCKFSKAYYHGSESNLGMFTYLCTQGLYGMNADDYCSRAERRN